MKNIFYLMVLLALTLSTMSCADNQSRKLLCENRWRLINMDGIDLTKYTDTDMFTVVFSESDSLMNGTGIFNRFFGTYTIGKSKIGIDVQGETKMYCPDDMERLFINQLGRVNKYKIENNCLELYIGKNLVATMESSPVIDHHTAETALDYEGLYKGLMIGEVDTVSLQLNDDSSYILDIGDTLKDFKGVYKIVGNYIALEDCTVFRIIKVEENQLRIQLESDRNEYVLKKVIE